MPDSLVTLEVRWFNLGTPPLMVERWFNYSCPGELLGPPAERMDLYLYAPQCEYLNLKLRQGKLELKWRQEVLGDWQFAELTGKVERWQKWSCEDSREQELLPPGAEAGWIEVKKVRSQRQYQGVVGELTQLTVQEHFWWSLAFEMAGDCLDSFKSVVSRTLQSYSGPKLSSDHSCAYPQWLSWQNSVFSLNDR